MAGSPQNPEPRAQLPPRLAVWKRRFRSQSPGRGLPLFATESGCSCSSMKPLSQLSPDPCRLGQPHSVLLVPRVSSPYLWAWFPYLPGLQEDDKFLEASTLEKDEGGRGDETVVSPLLYASAFLLEMGRDAGMRGLSCAGGKRKGGCVVATEQWRRATTSLARVSPHPEDLPPGGSQQGPRH